MKPIVLLTDFGLKDHYVGVLHAVLSRLASGSDRIDLCHEISPSDLWGAAFALVAAWPHLPGDSVVLAVVDPGVGSSRRGVAVKIGERWIVAPDNGLAAAISPVEKIVELCAQVMGLGKLSNTFHGRDLFAPAAAHLALGGDPDLLGSSVSIESLAASPLPSAEVLDDEVVGVVIHVDRFGNLITNIDAELLRFGSVVVWGQGRKAHIVASYFEGGTDEVIALEGSSRVLELAVNGGSAAHITGLDRGARIYLTSDGSGRHRCRE